MTGEDAWRLIPEETGRAALVFDRPGSSQNSLDSGSLRSLEGHLRAIESDSSITGLVLRGGKPKGFCAGADLKELASCRDEAEVEAFLRIGMSAIDRLARLPIPTVAVLHGVVLGGGLELALSCHSRVAMPGDSDVRIGTPEVCLGLIPGWGAISRLPRLVGLGPALRLLLDGQPIDAETALRIGLVDRVTSPDEVDSVIAGLIASKHRQPAEAQLKALPVGWREVLDRAHAEIGESGPPGPVRARHRLLEVMGVELGDGPDAGREAAIRELGALAMTPESRGAIESFARRSVEKGS